MLMHMPRQESVYAKLVGITQKRTDMFYACNVTHNARPELKVVPAVQVEQI